MSRIQAPHVPRARTEVGEPFSALRGEINRLFEDFGRWPIGLSSFGGDRASPRLDISETETAIEIDAELPGFTEDQINLAIDGAVLTLSGERTNTREEKDRNWHLQERSFGAFARRVELPFAPAADAVSARFKDGVLHVSVAKPPKTDASAKKITIEKL